MQLTSNSKLLDFLTFIGEGFSHISTGVLSRIQGRIDTPVSVLVESLKDEEGEIRWYAAWALSRMGSEARVAIPALIEALKDEEGEIRRLAAKTLRLMGADTEVPVSVLTTALGDREKDVHRFAARALAKVNQEMRKIPQH